MFFTKKQLGTFVKSIRLNEDTPLLNPINNYLVSQLDFPYFFNIICELIKIDNKKQINNSISYGKILLKQYSTRLKDTDQDMENTFYMKKDRYDLFISDILYPLLKIIQEENEYKWQLMTNKWGLWRIFAEDEKMPIGSEVCMNFKTGKNWLKM
jgi:hypothetical protein